jgi:hypothetical protein
VSASNAIKPHCSPRFSIGLLLASGPMRMSAPVMTTSDMVNVANAATGAPIRTAAQATSINAVTSNGPDAAIGKVSAAAIHTSSEQPSATRAMGCLKCAWRSTFGLALASGTTNMIPAMEFSVQRILAESNSGVSAGKAPAALVSIDRYRRATELGINHAWVRAPVQSSVVARIRPTVAAASSTRGSRNRSKLR